MDIIKISNSLENLYEVCCGDEEVSLETVISMCSNIRDLRFLMFLSKLKIYDNDIDKYCYGIYNNIDELIHVIEVIDKYDIKEEYKNKFYIYCAINNIISCYPHIKNTNDRKTFVKYIDYYKRLVPNYIKLETLEEFEHNISFMNFYEVAYNASLCSFSSSSWVPFPQSLTFEWNYENCEYRNGSFKLNDQLHNESRDVNGKLLPAETIIDSDSVTYRYYLFGKLNNTDRNDKGYLLPAIECPTNNKVYQCYVDGKEHNDSRDYNNKLLYAVSHNDCKINYINGIIHNDSVNSLNQLLPAVVHNNGVLEWHNNGKLHNDSVDDKNCQIPALSDSVNDRYIYKIHGVFHNLSVNENGFREPAYFHRDVKIIWAVNGLLHNDNVDENGKLRAAKIDLVTGEETYALNGEVIIY